MRRAAHRENADRLVLQRLDRRDVEQVLQHARIARAIDRRADQHRAGAGYPRHGLPRRLAIGVERAPVADIDRGVGEVQNIDGDARPLGCAPPRRRSRSRRRAGPAASRPRPASAGLRCRPSHGPPFCSGAGHLPRRPPRPGAARRSRRPKNPNPRGSRRCARRPAPAGAAPGSACRENAAPDPAARCRRPRQSCRDGRCADAPSLPTCAAPARSRYRSAP